MVQNGIFWTIGEQTYLVYYPIIYYLRIKVYRVERMDMRRPCHVKHQIQSLSKCVVTIGEHVRLVGSLL